MIEFMPDSGAKSSKRPPAVLIVEDESLVRLVAVEYLASVGYSVLEAGTAEGAIDTLMDHPVDLVFTDVQMPGVMDGNELAEWIRVNYPSIPVLLTSGIALDQGHGVGDLIRKPYELDTVKARIADALAMSRQRHNH